MNKALYEQYAQLEIQRRTIEAQQKTLKAVIQSDMEVENLDTVKSEFGSFIRCPVYTAWKYSKIVEQLEQQLDEKKAEEKAKKIATKTVTMGVKFTPVKETNENA